MEELYDLHNFPTMESEINVVKKGDRNLKDLTMIKLTSELLNNYKQYYPQLKHVRIGETNDVYAWVEPNAQKQMVCYLSIENKGNNEIWIQALEVLPGYRNHGLGRQLAEFAIMHNVNRLSVRANNEKAIKMYKHVGFEKYDYNGNMIFMRKISK